MAVTIAELDVNIRSTGDKAVTAIASLATHLNSLAGHLDKTAASIKKTSSALKGVGKDAKNAGNEAAKGAAGIGKFGKSILRIAGYRAIRSAMKMITQSFREGVQNIALYSQAIGGLDASKANQTMSAYASMGLQIKNSLGAAVIPLLANLIPMVQKIANLFMDAAEAVAKFFATLNGQGTYSAVNREYMVDYAKQLNKANGAAKELKRTILGFDSINALNSQSSGGGANANALDYDKMFVEKTNDWFGLKETFEDILKIVGLIGAAFLAWRISKNVIDTISTLGAMSRAKAFTLGLMLEIVGVTLSYGAGVNAARGNTGLAIAEGIGGFVSSALGGVLMGAALGHPLIGLAFGIIASIISFELGYGNERAKQRAREYIARSLGDTGLKVDDFSSDVIQAHMDLATEIRNKITDLDTIANPQALKDLNAARTLIEQIFTLSDIEIKTPQQMAELSALVETFNGFGLEGIQLEFDKTTGRVKQTKEEIYKSIDALREEIKTEAARAAAVKAYQLLIEAQEELNLLYTKRRVLMDALKKAVEDGDLGAMSKLAGQINDINDALHTQESNIKTLDTKWNSFLRQATGATDEWKTAVKSVGTVIGGLSFPSYSNGSWTMSKPQAKAIGGTVPTGDLFFAGERAPELIMASPNGSEVVNMAQFERAMMSAVSAAGGSGGDWTIVIQDESGNVKSRQVITAAERANRRDGRTIIPVGVY